MLKRGRRCPLKNVGAFKAANAGSFQSSLRTPFHHLINSIPFATFWQNLSDFLSRLEPQCDQIGRFLKIHINKFAHKHSQKNWWPLCYFEKDKFMLKLLWILFLETFGKLFYFNIWSHCLEDELLFRASSVLRQIWIRKNCGKKREKNVWAKKGHLGRPP